MKPKFSILTASFNYGRFIQDSIESVARQDARQTREHLIQDALSSDNTSSVVAPYSEEGAVSFVSEPDAGQSDALNKALARASGEVIGWLNADEYYLEGALSKVGNVFDTQPDVGVVFGDCYFVDERGATIRLLSSHNFSRFALRHYGCFISSCATFVRSDLIRGLGWDTRFRRAMDWDLWLTLSRSTRFKYLPVPLAAFRVHSAQVTNEPEDRSSPEFVLLRSKHDIHTSRFKASVAEAQHRYFKLIEGAYLRESKVEPDSPTKWWKSSC